MTREQATERPMETPWGAAQEVREYPNGILLVSTARHGGYFVPAHLLDRIPPTHREFAAEWSGSEQWYEEDCAWAAVVLAFPEVAQSPEHLKRAPEIAKEYLLDGDDDEREDWQEDPDAWKR